MFDVNAPHTMEALTKWWAEFRDSAPLADEDVADFCCILVGNKMDLATGSGDRSAEVPVTEAEAWDFLQELVPLPSIPPSPTAAVLPLNAEHFASEESIFQDHDNNLVSSSLAVQPLVHNDFPSSPQMRSKSIAIIPNPSSQSLSPIHQLSKSRSYSSSHSYGGTMTTSHTTLTIYHTPSSSLYQSARSSPELWSTSNISSPSTSPNSQQQTTSSTSASTRSGSTGSVLTITPSLFARRNSSATDTQPTTPGDREPLPTPPPTPDRGPRLFFTSAKTGEGVADVFEYIAWRVVRRWEYEETREACRMHIRDASNEGPIKLGMAGTIRWKDASTCCSS
jgi:Ras-related protein Rab-7A